MFGINRQSQGALALCAALFASALNAAPEWSALASSQESAQESPQKATRSARRILHFAHGGVMRVVARELDGHWEFQRSGSWITLEPGAVTRAPKEADVLREMKRRKRAVKKQGILDERVRLAEWMLEEGLAKESLRELDLVLEASPHHSGALGLLGRNTMIAVPSIAVSSAQLPEAQAALVRWAVQMPVAARELAIVELGNLTELEPLHASLLEALGGFSLRRRVFAAQAIGRMFPGEDTKRLLQHALLDTSSAVRRSAAQALGSADDTSVIAPMVRALDSKNARIRTQAAEALGFMGYAAAVEPLINYMTTALQSSGDNRTPHGYIFSGRQRAYIQDFDVEVATFQAVADPQVNVLLEGNVLEAGVIGINQYGSNVEASAARSSLGRLTGENPGHSGRAWKRWWETNRKQWAMAGASSGQNP